MVKSYSTHDPEVIASINTGVYWSMRRAEGEDVETLTYWTTIWDSLKESRDLLRDLIRTKGKDISTPSKPYVYYLTNVGYYDITGALYKEKREPNYLCFLCDSTLDFSDFKDTVKPLSDFSDQEILNAAAQTIENAKPSVWRYNRDIINPLCHNGLFTDGSHFLNDYYFNIRTLDIKPLLPKTEFTKSINALKDFLSKDHLGESVFDVGLQIETLHKAANKLMLNFYAVFNNVSRLPAFREDYNAYAKSDWIEHLPDKAKVSERLVSNLYPSLHESSKCNGLSDDIIPQDFRELQDFRSTVKGIPNIKSIQDMIDKLKTIDIIETIHGPYSLQKELTRMHFVYIKGVENTSWHESCIQLLSTLAFKALYRSELNSDDFMALSKITKFEDFKSTYYHEDWLGADYEEVPMELIVSLMTIGHAYLHRATAANYITDVMSMRRYYYDSLYEYLNDHNKHPFKMIQPWLKNDISTMVKSGIKITDHQFATSNASYKPEGYLELLSTFLGIKDPQTYIEENYNSIWFSLFEEERDLYVKRQANPKFDEDLKKELNQLNTSLDVSLAKLKETMVVEKPLDVTLLEYDLFLLELLELSYEPFEAAVETFLSKYPDDYLTLERKYLINKIPLKALKSQSMPHMNEVKLMIESFKDSYFAPKHTLKGGESLE